MNTEFIFSKRDNQTIYSLSEHINSDSQHTGRPGAGQNYRGRTKEDCAIAIMSTIAVAPSASSESEILIIEITLTTSPPPKPSVNNSAQQPHRLNLLEGLLRNFLFIDQYTQI